MRNFGIQKAAKQVAVQTLYSVYLVIEFDLFSELSLIHIQRSVNTYGYFSKQRFLPVTFLGILISLRA